MRLSTSSSLSLSLGSGERPLYKFYVVIAKSFDYLTDEIEVEVRASFWRTRREDAERYILEQGIDEYGRDENGFIYEILEGEIPMGGGT